MISEIMEAIKKIYTLNKSKKALKRAHRLYRQKESRLGPPERARVQEMLTALQNAILQKEPELAKKTIQQLEEFSGRFMAKSLFEKARDFILSMGFALLVAIVIRQMWFEFYSIPTGSMRPTLKEGDYLVVSKTDYGINTPMRSGHFYFDPDLVERGSIIVFNGENMDMPDDDTMYFYIIPGKKQYIKRLIGKPGDTLYFYGGQIYGINARGQELPELLDPKNFLEHIPFIRFEGKVETPERGTAVIYQMNEPLAKLQTNQIGNVTGEILSKKGVRSFSDLWGMKNYGMSRLLTPEQAKQMHPLQNLESGVLYLEIHHHPSIAGAKVVRDEMGRMRPGLATSISLLPLTQEHVNEILAHMTTCRFEVKEGRVYRYGSGYTGEHFRPKLAVPDGMYEMQDGIAQEILTGGIAKKLKPDHPLFAKNPEQIQTLYNFGFEWSNHFIPSPHAPLPSRYAYFRNGDLYLMGGPVVKKGDPFLTLFRKREYEKQAMSTSVKPYAPFDDAGAPIKEDGKLDIEFIQKFGLTIPDKMYLAMGDNHAMSADSRHFGFVPQNNLRGGASFLFWPAGDRWGRLPQAVTQHLTIPNLTIWALAIIIGSLSYIYIQRKYFRPFEFK